MICGTRATVDVKPTLDDLETRLEGTRQQHPDDPHREDLNARAGHVQHDRLHGQGFSRTESR
jgi:hypothetical protein